MVDGQSRVDKKALDGVRDRDGGDEAGKEDARQGGREDERTSDETRHSHRRISD